MSVQFSLKGIRHTGRQSPNSFTAVEDVSFELEKGETLGIVGESGSGKTTLVRSIVGTVTISRGRIMWMGSDLFEMDPVPRRQVRKDISMVFQNPLGSLNPSMTIGQIIAEPYRIHYPLATRAEIRSRVGETMEWVGLAPRLVNRYPHEFSGGQCQRVAIARALIPKPKLIICDEPVAALDVSVRAQIVNLLKHLQEEFGISLILISHDLSVIRHISNKILILYLGNVMEIVSADKLIEKSRHPYTRILIKSVPVPDPAIQKTRKAQIMQKDPSSLGSSSAGCKFEKRCSIVRSSCSIARPGLIQAERNHWVACPYTE